jgi:CO/xanthine dehydrogenase FAD-binding subunit
MIGPFSYIKPRTLDEALAALQEDGARVLAGGTDLLVEMRNGERHPRKLVDIKGLEDLRQIAVNPEKGAAVGACVPLNVIIDNAEVRAHLPVLAEAAFSIATYQLRNRATLVGNICNASPAADMAPALYVLGAEVVAAGAEGERRLPIEEFFTGVKRNALKKGEMVLRVEIPATGKAKTVFLKKQRVKGHDLAMINVAGLANSRSGILRICVGACAPTPVLIPDTDSLFRESKDPELLADRVAKLGQRVISPIDDVRSSREYRMDMAAVFVKRAVRQICSGG